MSGRFLFITKALHFKNIKRFFLYTMQAFIEMTYFYLLFLY